MIELSRRRLLGGSATAWPPTESRQAVSTARHRNVQNTLVRIGQII